MKKLWYGGTIYTMEREGETVEAVLVEDDKIVAVGTMDELKNQADEQIDLQGAAMYPDLSIVTYIFYFKEKSSFV